MKTYTWNLTHAEAANSSPIERDLRLALQIETLAVRGEGLPSQIEWMALGLYGPHRRWMTENLGFDIWQAFRFAKAVWSLVERRFNLRKNEARKRSDEARATFSTLLAADSAQLSLEDAKLAEEIRQIGLEEAANRIGVHWLFGSSPAILGLTPEEIARELGDETPSPALQRFLYRLSQRVGEAKGPPDPLEFNPLANRPFVVDAGRYYLFVPPVLLDALLNAFHFDIMSDEAYRPTYDDARSSWLEQEALAVFKHMFPHGEVHWRLKYGPNNAQKELDGLVYYDNKIVLIEGKWKTLRLAARQGQLIAAKEDITRAIVDSYQQGVRARDYIRTSNESAVFEDANGQKVSVPSGKIREIYIVSLLGRGIIGTLAANLPRLGLGLFGPEEYPWALPLIDLLVVGEFIEFPSQLFDYLKRRDAMLKDGRFMMHDEWDMLGCYLAGFLDPTLPQYGGADFVVLTGMDTEIDHYLRARATRGLPDVEKPRRKVPDQVRKLVTVVETTHQPGRSDFVIALLGFSDAALDSIDKMIGETIAKTVADGSRHSFSFFPVGGECGITLVCVRGDPEGLSRSLAALCLAKKYETRAQTWLGLGIDVSLAKPPHVISYREGDWVRDSELERLLPVLKKPGTQIRGGTVDNKR